MTLVCSDATINACNACDYYYYDHNYVWGFGIVFIILFLISIYSCTVWWRDCDYYDRSACRQNNFQLRSQV